MTSKPTSGSGRSAAAGRGDGIVFLVDDDRSFLTAAARLLRASGYHVETFGSARDLLERLKSGAPGCVVADLRMPGMDGLALQEEIARLEEPLPIVFLTGEGDVPSSVEAMKHGAVDFLGKRAPKKELLEAIDRARARGASERAARAERRAARARYLTLTPREVQVLAGVVQGLLNKQIAWALGIHERTVKLHRTGIMTKLGLDSVAELTRWVGQAGLLAELDAVARGFPRGQ
jgi:FixJ family two-component response regulator